MEKARKKIRICLICVVTSAVVLGAIYYFYNVRGGEAVTGGTLVHAQTQTEGVWEM